MNRRSLLQALAAFLLAPLARFSKTREPDFSTLRDYKLGPSAPCDPPSGFIVREFVYDPKKRGTLIVVTHHDAEFIDMTREGFNRAVSEKRLIG